MSVAGGSPAPRRSGTGQSWGQGCCWRWAVHLAVPGSLLMHLRADLGVHVVNLAICSRFLHAPREEEHMLNI